MQASEIKKPADFLSSVCVIEPSAHESSAGRDRKNEKQSSLLIFLNSCDHTYKHALLLHWWFSRTHDKLTLRWGSWVKINTTQWWSLPLWHVWESLSYVQAPGTDETKEKSIENGLKLFMKDLSIIPQITSPYSKAFLRCHSMDCHPLKLHYRFDSLINSVMEVCSWVQSHISCSLRDETNTMAHLIGSFYKKISETDRTCVKIHDGQNRQKEKKRLFLSRTHSWQVFNLRHRQYAVWH